ncbi:MAG: hypothetical protein QM527_09455 [Alphaproteobacteria bacterium]|nr:hypothetical protein [Alphaproteobacteria bacterium]
MHPLDPQVAALFADHRTYLASLPDQHAEFLLTHTSLDENDKSQLRSQGVEFKPQQTSGYGTALAHQPKLVGGDHWGKGLYVQGKSTLDMENIKAFDANALDLEMNSVNGPSGSTNIMSFMYLQMQKENPSFNLQDAFAGTMMFLTMDGGHSLPESVGTFRSIISDTRPTVDGNGTPLPEYDQIMAKRQQVIQTNTLAYGHLSQMFDNPSTSNAVQSAVDRAWDRTRQTFDEVHAQRNTGNTL